MKKIFCFLTITLTIIFSQSHALAAKKNDSDELSQKQTEQIQNVVHDYLVKKPQVLIEASQALQKQEEEKGQIKITQIEDRIPKLKDQIFDDKAPGRVVIGNPNGKITMVEFTQHQCHHCKSAKPVVKKMLQENPELKLIVIYSPFFGNDAIHSAKAAIAAHKQNKYDELNQALLGSASYLNKEKTDEIIKKTSGINSKKLYKDMDNKDLDDGLKANLKLVMDLKLIGTPSFIFTNEDMTKFSMSPSATPSDLNRALNKVSK